MVFCYGRSARFMPLTLVGAYLNGEDQAEARIRWGQHKRHSAGLCQATMERISVYADAPVTQFLSWDSHRRVQSSIPEYHLESISRILQRLISGKWFRSGMTYVFDGRFCVPFDTSSSGVEDLRNTKF